MRQYEDRSPEKVPSPDHKTPWSPSFYLRLGLHRILLHEVQQAGLRETSSLMISVRIWKYLVWAYGKMKLGSKLGEPFSN